MFWTIVAGGGIAGALLMVFNLGAIVGSTSDMLDHYAKVLDAARNGDDDEDDNTPILKPIH